MEINFKCTSIRYSPYRKVQPIVKTIKADCEVRDKRQVKALVESVMKDGEIFDHNLHELINFPTSSWSRCDDFPIDPITFKFAEKIETTYAGEPYVFRNRPAIREKKAFTIGWVNAHPSKNSEISKWF